MKFQRPLVDIGIAVGLIVALGSVFALDHGQPKSVGEGKQKRRIGSLVSRSGLYELRDAQNREEWITDYGGSVISEKSVTGGLQWLARHQAKSGEWANEHIGAGTNSVCEPSAQCPTGGVNYPHAQTGLALLAFLAGGHYDFNKTDYSNNVRDGLDWLVANQHDDGGLYHTEDSHHMYQHGIAAFALAEACAVAHAKKREPDKRYLAAARKAIQFIEDNQHNDGGWRYSRNKYEGGDTSVSGWQVLALKTAREAGITVTPGCLEKAEGFFKSCETGSNGRTSYTAGGSPLTDATTGVGMLVHQFLLHKPHSELVNEAAPYLADLAEASWGGDRNGSSDFYLWYNCTLAMFQHGGPEWDRWNYVVREHVIALQEGDEAGCARGSWAPNSRHGGAGGRIYTTALAVLTLEVYYRFANVDKSGQ